MRGNIRPTTILGLLLILIASPSLQAQWIENGVAVCIEDASQMNHQITSDGENGAIMVWEDRRAGEYCIYAQRADAWGRMRWTTNGVAICTASGNVSAPAVAGDGAGGAFIAWADNRNGNYDIFVQRVDADGTPLWMTDGIAICTATDNQSNPLITSDGAGGAYIVWIDYRDGYPGFFAQRINGNGIVQWTSNGEVVNNITGDKGNPAILLDSLGGLIVAWDNVAVGGNDILVQRLDSDGNMKYAASGQSICAADGYQMYPQIISDELGGAIIAWYDRRNGIDWDVYTQRITNLGSTLWTINGEAICTVSGPQNLTGLVRDDMRGAIITWYDYRISGPGIYAQRIDRYGAVQWGADGKMVIDEEYGFASFAVSNGLGGAIISWTLHQQESYDYDIFAQNIDAGGDALWPADGICVTNAWEDQNNHRITSDGRGGAVISWEDKRNGTTSDIYAQRIEADGYWGYPSPFIHEVRDVPGDQGGYINLSWNASRLDLWPDQMITHYSVWRAINTAVPIAFADGAVSFISDVNELCFDRQGTVILMEQSESQLFYWELVTTQDANSYETYSKFLATHFDSTSECTEYYYFQVAAHASDPAKSWTSPPDSGYSVDNLAPCPPAALAGEQQYIPIGLLLTWNLNSEADLDCYAVYRGLTEEFEPGPGNLVASPCDTFALDTGWTWDSGYFYKVSAIDIHGNESSFALLGPTEITGEDIPDTPSNNYLAQNYPNPFNPMTTIAFRLKAPANVSLKIYDSSGRIVRVLVNEKREAARYVEEWNGKDNDGRPVASGIYFYRLAAGDFVQTRKMVLLR